MTRVNYREAQERFGHIDAEIVQAGCRIGPDGRLEDAHVVLRLYAWWEHPLYLAAVAEGRSWGIHAGDDAQREMRIEAVAPRKAELRPGRDATDLVFSTQHPSLWEYEEHADIICNSDLDVEALLDALMRRNLPHVGRRALADYLSAAARYRAPYSLGSLPRSLFVLVQDELRRMGVETLASYEPKARAPLVRMTLDPSVEIVAEDFIVDVPEFVHRPEWFRPAPRDR